MQNKRTLYDFFLTAALRWQFRLLENPKAKNRAADLLKFIKDNLHQFDERVHRAARNIQYQPHMRTYTFDQYFWFLFDFAPCNGASVRSAAVVRGVDRAIAKRGAA